MTGSLSSPSVTFVCVADAPTPYRLHLFNSLAGALAAHGVAFEVQYLAGQHADRPWQVDLGAARFRYSIASGIYAITRRVPWHFNPGVVAHLLRHPPDLLLLGGRWHLPTITLLALGSSGRRAPLTILWAEANPDSSRHPGGPVAWARRRVFAAVDAFAVPGTVAASAVGQAGGAGRPVLPLPNVVDEHLFRDEVDRLRTTRTALRVALGLPPDRLVILWPARLDERDKGIVNFLSAVPDLLTGPITVLIAGDGPDRGAIEQWLRDRPAIGDRVRLLGHCPGERMLELLAMADAFLLPSLADPNPIAVVEALWAGLPLLVSKRCGNWPEAVEPDANGWLVDPSSAGSLRDAFSALVATPPTARAKLGRRSRAIAEERFATEPSVDAFADAVVRLLKLSAPLGQ